MKTLKYLTICFVVCSMFAGSVFSQCTVGMSINLVGKFVGGEDAIVGELGDQIWYTVTVSRVGLCPLINGEVSLFVPDGIGGVTEIPVASDLSLDANDVAVFPDLGPYTISELDLGGISSPIGGTPDGDEVRAYASIEGDSVRDEGGPQNGGAIQNFDTQVINPCIKVEKTAECDVAQTGDVFDYTITITNCGGEELTAVSIFDDP
ncbi:MAG: hypothetical protein DRP56_05155, partial [Planctomycetota bacterium]